jgi:N-acetylglucosaminyldiphosphoundecaprenol N-acetyl-beta-D-mannosaminyltransferase
MRFVNFFKIKLVDASARNILNYCIKNKIKIINCLNPHSYIKLLNDKLFYSVFKFKKSINIIDGVGIQLYFFFIKRILVFRVVGYDILLQLFDKFPKKKIFFLGSSNLILKSIKNRIKIKYPNIKVAYYSPPHKFYFNKSTNNSIIRKINNFKPHALCVGLGAPKQEKWSFENLKFINAKLILNIGGALDYYGKYNRPHYIFRKLGLEWLVRLKREPFRLVDRTFLSALFFIFFLIKYTFVKNYKYFNYLYLNIYDNIKKIKSHIKNRNSFMLSAFNLQFCISILINDRFYSNKVILWADGVFCKIFNYKINKIPGSEILRKIQLNHDIIKIIIIVNYRADDDIFLKKKFNKITITNYPLPYASKKILIRNLPKFKNLNTSLILITLPTPKQEYIGAFILKKYSKAKIICIGGGLSIASGYEKECPNFLRKIYLESLWRIQFEPARRIKRLVVSIIYLIYFTFLGKFSNLRIKKV